MEICRMLDSICKEHLDGVGRDNPVDAQPGKLQHAAAGTRRQPLADALLPPADMEFASRADNALLNKKMKGKNKLDYKSLQNEAESLRMKLQHVDSKSAQVDYLLAVIGTCTKVSGAVARQLDSKIAKVSALQKTCLYQRNKIQTMQIKLAAANEELAAANEKLKVANEELAASNEKLKRSDMTVLSLQSSLEAAEKKILDGEKLRKKLHNTILELKGNIRVFCRVRPLLPNESGAVSYPKNGENLGRGVELLDNGRAQQHSFTFDKVFDHSASQEDVFIEISELVQSALDGYKVCIFAYGQTGSGKSYTMIGDTQSEDKKGMIPRSLEQIFQATQALNSQGWIYKMQASMLEIYNDNIHDLLATNRVACIINHDANGNVTVLGPKVVDITSMSQVSSLFNQAAKIRSVGTTQMNEESSRSHCVFTLRIFGTNERTDDQVQGVLNLIDLAGSERVDKSGAIGDRLKEAQAINRSLFCLSNVISSIAMKKGHVPFRDSKLTQVLQPFLGGNTKMLMFVNLSPDVSSAGESLESLRFAEKVNSCDVGIARRQTQTEVDTARQKVQPSSSRFMSTSSRPACPTARQKARQPSSSQLWSPTSSRPACPTARQKARQPSSSQLWSPTSSRPACPTARQKHDEKGVYNRRGEPEEESEDFAKPKHKGTEGLIEIENPNLVKSKNIKVKDIDIGKTTDISRCEREELEKQRSRDHHMKRQEQGKTEQARKDLEPLTLIRQQRAEARRGKGCQRREEG